MLRNLINSPYKIGIILFFVVFLFTVPVKAHNWMENHNHGPDYYDGCRDVVKKIRITNTVTHVERGVACQNSYGVWSMATDTKYPFYPAQVYIKNRGKMMLIGDLSPQHYRGYGSTYFEIRSLDYDWSHNHHQPYQGHECNKYRDYNNDNSNWNHSHGRGAEGQNHENFNWNGKNNHKKH